MSGAFDGMLVLDLTSHLSGPYCGMMLADHGADVIKIERPDGGDNVRTNPPFVNGESAPFMIWNRNKRSITMDLKRREDQADFLAMVDRADFVIENFRPGTMERLALGWNELHARNPRLIYGTISGYGQTGPYRDRGGFDLIMQGMSGLAANCGPIDGPPHRMPIAITDIAAGMHLAFGLLAALEVRHKTGLGQYVETSLLEAGISLGVYEAAHYFATNEQPKRIGQAHRGGSPYQILATRDGHIIVGAAQNHFWVRFCQLLGAPELVEDARFRKNADRVGNNTELVKIIESKLKIRDSAEWLALLEKADIPCGPVLNTVEALNDPQVIERQMVVGTDHPVTGHFRNLGVTVKLSATPGSVRRPAPRHGEHTAEVLAEFRKA